MMRLQYAILYALLSLQTAYANVGKLVFLAPSALQTMAHRSTLPDLELEYVSPQFRTIRTKLRADFPTSISPRGVESWILLDNLREGQRYEFRVCWAGTQPTIFKLNVFNIEEIFEDPELVAALTAYSLTRHTQDDSIEYRDPSISKAFKESDYYSNQRIPTTLIQIFAKADYFTTNQTLMDQVPPVLVDMTLDPYILNVYPESLLGTGVYLVIIAIFSWYFAGFMAKWLKSVARSDEAKKDVVQEKEA